MLFQFHAGRYWRVWGLLVTSLTPTIWCFRSWKDCKRRVGKAELAESDDNIAAKDWGFADPDPLKQVEMDPTIRVGCKGLKRWTLFVLLMGQAC